MLKQLEFGSLRHGGAETKISVGDTDPMQTTIQWAWYKGLMVQSHQIVCPGWPGEESPKLLTGLPVAVSYTHRDVYKRQRYGRSEAYKSLP